MRGEIEIEIPFPKFPILSPPSGLEKKKENERGTRQL
jgi:hypothetical protein